MVNFLYCLDSNYNYQAFSSMISILDNTSIDVNFYIIHKDEEILEWLWIYDFVVNELGEDHLLLTTPSGMRAHNFIYKGLFSLGLVSDDIKLDYVKNTLRGKDNKQFHKEFFDWTPSWK